MRGDVVEWKQDALGQTTFEFHVEEPGVLAGVPTLRGHVVVRIPDWLISKTCLEEFKAELAGFIRAWAPSCSVYIEGKDDAPHAHPERWF